MYSKNWVEKTQLIIDPIIDIYFLVAVDGSDRISSAGALRNINTLTSAYRAIISRSASKGGDFSEIEHEFWVRPLIQDASGQTRHAFQWYDHLEEACKFLAWLEDSSSACDFVDLDQGWGFAARKVNDNVHLLDFNPDTGIELAHSFLPHGKLLLNYKSAYNRAAEVIALLDKRLGKLLQYNTTQWIDRSSPASRHLRNVPSSM